MGAGVAGASLASYGSVLAAASRQRAAFQSSEPLSGEITFYWYEDRFADTMREYIAQFEAANPGTKINLEILPFSTYFERLPVQISSGNAPDVFFLVSGQVQNYARMEVLADLTELVPEEELAQFRPAQIDFSTYEDTLIAVPFTTTVLTMLINQDLFEQAGIEVPTDAADAWTREEFADVLRTLKEQGNLVSAMNNGGRDFWWLPWFYGNGASLLNETLDEATFDSPEALEAFQYLRGLTEEGLIAPPPNAGASAQENQQLFVQGRQAIYSAGHWDMAGLLDSIGDRFTIGAAMFPVGPTPALALGGDYLVVSKDSDNPALAGAFISFLTSREIVEDYASRYFYLPPRLDATPEYTANAEVMELVQTEAAEMASPTLTLHRGLPRYADMNAIFMAEYQLVMLGEKSPEDALAAIDAGINQILSQ
jgi:multiple sugar transport system substrate-binding protein